MPTTLTHGAYPGAASLTTPSRTIAQPGLGRRLWRFLMAMGARRAEPHILMLAAQVELTDPELARQMRQRLRDSQPD